MILAPVQPSTTQEDIKRMTPFVQGFHIDAFRKSELRHLKCSKPIELHILGNFTAKAGLVIAEQGHPVLKGGKQGIFMPPAGKHNAHRLQFFCIDTKECVKMIKAARKLNPRAEIGVEGNITLDNLVALRNAGADVFVLGFLWETSYLKEMSSLCLELLN